MKILLIRPDKAGDAIKTIPVLRALVRLHPEDNFSVLASTHNVSLFEKEAGIHTFCLPGRWEKLSEAELSQAVLDCDRGYDKIILLPCDPTLKMLEIVEQLESDEKFISKSNPAGTPETDNIARLVDLALGSHVLNEWRNGNLAPIITEQDRLEAAGTLGKKNQSWLGFSPFAGTDQRTHPTEKWESFLSHLSKKEPHTQFVIFGASSEAEKLRALARHAASQEQIKIVFPSSFRALGAYLLMLDGLVAVDSGPLHFALSLGVPSLGLMSGGDKKRWYPSLGPKDLIIRRGVLNRYPSIPEMLLAFRKWRKLNAPKRMKKLEHLTTFVA